MNKHLKELLDAGGRVELSYDGSQDAYRIRAQLKVPPDFRRSDSFTVYVSRQCVEQRILDVFDEALSDACGKMLGLERRERCVEEDHRRANHSGVRRNASNYRTSPPPEPPQLD